jgi:hypothetical protein
MHLLKSDNFDLDFQPPLVVPPFGRLELELRGTIGTVRVFDNDNNHIESRLNCLVERCTGDNPQVRVLWRGGVA